MLLLVGLLQELVVRATGCYACLVPFRKRVLGIRRECMAIREFGAHLWR